MKAIIIDDEPKAIELIRSYLRHFSSIEILETFRNGLRALEFLSNQKVDVAFLDINMPHISGMALSKIINPNIKIIFTTAYSEFAVESYNVRAVDYLLKPISLERFTIAMGKLLSTPNKMNSEESNTTILIKSGNRYNRINTEEIHYLKKEGNYTTYFTNQSKFLARESIKESLQKLPQNFMQTHKSYIVNLNKISVIEKDMVYVNNYAIPIGGSFKVNVNNRLFPI